MEYGELKRFNGIVENFLSDARNGKISRIQRINFYNFVWNLEKRTETQKIRFLLYYDLMPNKNEKKLTYSDIGKAYNCSISAIRISIIEVKNTFSRIGKEKTEKLLKIIK